MNRIYRIEKGIVVPDGTEVFEIIGPVQSSKTGLPIVEEQSLAFGKLDPGEKSSVHVHPIISHLTWVVSGTLTVGMKDPASKEMYYINVRPRETLLTQPGTYFQLLNNSSDVVEILYIVSPAFIYEVADDGTVLYNDQIVLDMDWEQLALCNWTIPELADMHKIRRAREKSMRRLQSPHP